jgi:glycerate kinase
VKILIAPDKFKGSLTAQEAAERIAVGLGPDFDCRILPLADGGEGTAEAILSALHGSRETRWVEDPLGRLVEASFALVSDRSESVAVIDMSAASGLWRLAEREREPWRASTTGTGQLIRAAAELGVSRILLGLGGSATNDGGAGMARALGYRFFDGQGREVTDLPGQLSEVKRIEPTGLKLPPVVAACDVTNPLLGSAGATRVYGPQKGIEPDRLEAHENRLALLADLVERDLGFEGRERPGAGAAGGLGFGAMAFCGAELQSGFQLVAELTGLRAALQMADAVVTGEGSLDGQTLNGKGPHGVAVLARALGKPVLALAGRIEPGCGIEDEFDLARQIAPEGTPQAESIRQAGLWLEIAARDAADWLRNRFRG